MIHGVEEDAGELETATAPDDQALFDAEIDVEVRQTAEIARYGQTWRGIKPKLAAQHGAVGCIIYSDPKEDGYVRGGSYPDGPMRPSEGVQRGSVMDMPVYPGDPQTPGIGAKAGVKLIPLDKVETITKIDRYEEPSGQLIAEWGWVTEDAVEFRASRAGRYFGWTFGQAAELRLQGGSDSLWECWIGEPSKSAVVRRTDCAAQRFVSLRQRFVQTRGS